MAALYGVQTRSLVQAIKRNIDRFPEDFQFRLVPAEVESLRSQIVISKPGRGGRRYPPVAFTEHGALMAATVLNSPRAVAMSLYVIRAFVKMGEDLAANAALLRRLAEIDKSLLTHDLALRDIYQKLVRCWSRLHRRPNLKSDSTLRKTASATAFRAISLASNQRLSAVNS